MPSNSIAERRAALRFPIKAEVEYQLINGRSVVANGRGRTVNISSSGVLFESAEPLSAGLGIEMYIAWPAQLCDTTALVLRVAGRTVRVQENCTAMRILRYEYHTRGSRI